jgi:hypothetical protein
VIEDLLLSYHYLHALVHLAMFVVELKESSRMFLAPHVFFWHLMFCFHLAASYFALFVVCAVSLPLPVPWLLKWLMNWFSSNR